MKKKTCRLKKNIRNGLRKIRDNGPSNLTPKEKRYLSDNVSTHLMRTGRKVTVEAVISFIKRQVGKRGDTKRHQTTSNKRQVNRGTDKHNLKTDVSSSQP